MRTVELVENKLSEKQAESAKLYAKLQESPYDEGLHSSVSRLESYIDALKWVLDYSDPNSSIKMAP